MALLDHNKQAYERIRILYKNVNDILLVHGTGLGKSFIFMELLSSVFRGKNILFVVPKHAVKDGINSYEEYEDNSNIDFKTYNHFTDDERIKEVYNTYDVIVFDEAHHLGSGKFGMMARKLFPMVQGTEKKILGMTATNIREDKRDVSEYFTETVIGMSTFEAICTGLIPPFEYLVCQDNADQKAGYDRKVSDYKKVLDYADSLPLLSETIRKNPKKRWLCFFPSIEKLEEHEDIVRKIFDEDYELLKITTKHDTSIAEITNHEKTVVLCVDKLLEGVHVPKTQGIILFRNIQSLPVFQQVLGRVVHVGEKESPLVLDCTKTAIKMLAKLLKAEGSGSGGFSGGVSKPVLYCRLENAEHFNLTKLLALASTKEDRPWDENEIAILRKYYPSEGTRMYKRLTDRTPSACKTKANLLGISWITGEWTQEEDDILKEYYPKEGDKVSSRLKNRTTSACRARARVLNLKHVQTRFWKEEEDDLIRKYYPMEGRAILKRIPWRSKSGVENRAKVLGVTCNNQKLRWTEEEVNILKKYYPLEGRAVAKRLIGRNEVTCAAKAKSLNIKKKSGKACTIWNEDAIQFLKDNYGKMDRSEIAEKIGVSKKAVSGAITRFGLKKII